MKNIDARGLNCPEPVIKTKNALDEHKEVITIVDNKDAAANVKRMAEKLDSKVNIIKDNDFYKVKIKRKDDKENTNLADDKGRVYFIKSDILGKGEKQLGRVLIQGFFHTLLEQNPLPHTIIFINSGVKLPTLNENVIDSLKILKEKGVNILACGTCLDYYNLSDKLKVGEISNMYEIVESLNRYQVISI